MPPLDKDTRFMTACSRFAWPVSLIFRFFQGNNELADLSAIRRKLIITLTKQSTAKASLWGFFITSYCYLLSVRARTKLDN